MRFTAYAADDSAAAGFHADNDCVISTTAAVAYAEHGSVHAESAAIVETTVCECCPCALSPPPPPRDPLRRRERNKLRHAVRTRDEAVLGQDRLTVEQQKRSIRLLHILRQTFAGRDKSSLILQNYVG